MQKNTQQIVKRFDYVGFSEYGCLNILLANSLGLAAAAIVLNSYVKAGTSTLPAAGLTYLHCLYMCKLLG